MKQREKRERKVGKERKKRTSDNERQSTSKEGGGWRVTPMHDNLFIRKDLA